jgi:hypothetical protein
MKIEVNRLERIPEINISSFLKDMASCNKLNNFIITLANDELSIKPDYVRLDVDNEKIVVFKNGFINRKSFDKVVKKKNSLFTDKTNILWNPFESKLIITI